MSHPLANSNKDEEISAPRKISEPTVDTKYTSPELLEGDEEEYPLQGHTVPSPTTKPCRQYLVDRYKGTSKLGNSRPPCYLCYVPFPVIWFSDYIEQNPVFEWLGSCGCYSPANVQARKYCVGVGLVCNILCFFLSIYACFAISIRHDVIWFSSFTSGSFVGDNFTIDVRIGMKAVALSSDDIDLGRDEVLLFEDFCKFHDAGISVPSNARCGDCDAISNSMIFTLVVSSIMCIPSITTSVVRLYPHYDCNCQKVFASFAAIISVGFSIWTMVSYQFQCFHSLRHAGDFCVASLDDTIFPMPAMNTTCPSGSIQMHRLYHAGPGWCCMSAAVCLKCFDMLLNMAIPAPTICRDHAEQQQYELLYSPKSTSSCVVIGDGQTPTRIKRI